jgi:DNA repair photolyase
MKNKIKVSGTKEWAKYNVNCSQGCSHNCRYCYARANALRFKQIKNSDEWKTEKIRQNDVDKPRYKMNGTIMFPTTHDITPYNVDACLIVLKKLLIAGNNVLIVSKPHIDCIEKLCTELKYWRDQILFRFTIGAMNDDILLYWEPNAPCYDERKTSLEHAYMKGFATSVSIEPMLDAENIYALWSDLVPWVTDSIWIGKMNKVRNRVIIEDSSDEKMVSLIEEGQTDNKIKEIYEKLKDALRVKWKESIKEVVGLDLATETGLDQ